MKFYACMIYKIIVIPLRSTLQSSVGIINIYIMLLIVQYHFQNIIKYVLHIMFWSLNFYVHLS